jgi:hypothetical protein
MSTNCGSVQDFVPSASLFETGSGFGSEASSMGGRLFHNFANSIHSPLNRFRNPGQFINLAVELVDLHVGALSFGEEVRWHVQPAHASVTELNIEKSQDDSGGLRLGSSFVCTHEIRPERMQVRFVTNRHGFRERAAIEYGAHHARERGRARVVEKRHKKSRLPIAHRAPVSRVRYFWKRVFEFDDGKIQQ